MVISVLQTPDGGYTLSSDWPYGMIDPHAQSSSWDFLLLRLDTNGIIQWQKIYGGSNIDYANSSIQQTLDGGVNGKVKVYQFWENKSVPPLWERNRL
jgi:hypothetical protein